MLRDETAEKKKLAVTDEELLHARDGVERKIIFDGLLNCILCCTISLLKSRCRQSEFDLDTF